jgi:NADP-dependent 3-hydroxy acid dehydrogenase YdfG
VEDNKSEMKTIAKPIALITGTSSGFGILAALTLAHAGYLFVPRKLKWNNLRE